MEPYEKKGTIFEMTTAHHIEQYKQAIVITHFDVYSFSLRRKTPIDILIILGNNIFVLELKSFSTRLKGGYSDRIWIGTSYVRNYYIFNPVIQVKEKLRSLQRKFKTKEFNLLSLCWHYYIIVSDFCEICADKTIVKNNKELEYIIGENIDAAGTNSNDILKRLMTGGD